jgi:hypothetical protein
MQSFSRNRPLLNAAYLKSFSSKANPDFGKWLNDPIHKTVGILPVAIRWLSKVHNARKKVDLSHPAARVGGGRAIPTRPVSYKFADSSMIDPKAAWSDLLAKWKIIL